MDETQRILEELQGKLVHVRIGNVTRAKPMILVGMQLLEEEHYFTAEVYIRQKEIPDA